MGSINIEAEDVWGYYTRHKKSLTEEMALLASNADFGVEIWLTDENGSPAIYVYADDNELYEETVVSEKDCVSTATRIYAHYLSGEVLDDLLDIDDVKQEPLPGFEDYSIDDEIDERENQLDDAVLSFICEAGGDGFDDRGLDLDELISDCKEHFLEYLARKHGIRVYRPMFLEADDGTEFYEEYPYEQMIFDD